VLGKSLLIRATIEGTERFGMTMPVAYSIHVLVMRVAISDVAAFERRKIAV
jgi:hypothetical protein